MEREILKYFIVKKIIFTAKKNLWKVRINWVILNSSISESATWEKD